MAYAQQSRGVHAFGRQRTIGDMLLRDETTEVEHALKKAIGVAE